MKANLKGRGGIKGLLLLHGEKIAIVVVGMLALWFIYSSLKLPRLESKYQASNLQNQITETKTQVDNFDWETAVRDHADQMRVFKPIAKAADTGVDEKPFAIEGLDPAVVTPTVLRADPLVLNATDVRAIGGSGLLAFTDPAIRKQWELKQAREQVELEKELAKKAQDQQQNPEGAPGGQGRRGRGRGDGPEMGMEFDPKFPNRRLVEGLTQPAGVPTQGFERIEQVNWAMVVAKVPIREQLKLYQDAFENARGSFVPERDFPRYAGYVVQRREIVGGKPTAWQTVDLYDGQQKSIRANLPIQKGVNFAAVNKLYDTASKEWAGMPMDPVDGRYKNYVLTLPLPPLVGRDWGADATHPDIPLAVDAPPIEQEIEPLAQQPEEEPVGPDGEITFDGGDPNQVPQAGFGQPGQMPSGGFRGRGGFGGPGEFGPSASMMYGGGGREMGGGEFGRGASYSGGGIPAAGQATTLPRGVDFYLLRFFDFTVEPGKKYQYQVRLALMDPNHGLPDNMLEQAVQDRHRKEWQKAKELMGVKAKRPMSRIVEKWSDPSPTVGIPLSGGVWLAEAALKSEKLHNDEPTVTLWAETFDLNADGMAIHVGQEKKFRRGSVINLDEKMKYAGENDRWIDTFEDPYKLQTGVTLLDVEGADKLGRDMTTPARVLLMGPAGDLMIRTEPDDRPAVARLRLMFSESDRRRGGREDMRGGPEGMFGQPGGPGRSGR